ncbi:unnamed protein product [Rhodiola kirilowii]
MNFCVVKKAVNVISSSKHDVTLSLSPIPSREENRRVSTVLSCLHQPLLSPPLPHSLPQTHRPPPPFSTLFPAHKQRLFFNSARDYVPLPRISAHFHPFFYKFCLSLHHGLKIEEGAVEFCCCNWLL